jgi:hypothetical protein
MQIEARQRCTEKYYGADKLAEIKPNIVSLQTYFTLAIRIQALATWHLEEDTAVLVG